MGKSSNVPVGSLSHLRPREITVNTINGAGPLSQERLEKELDDMNRLSAVHRIASVCSEFMTDRERGKLADTIKNHITVPFDGYDNIEKSFYLTDWACRELLPEVMKVNDEWPGKVATLPEVGPESVHSTFTILQDIYDGSRQGLIPALITSHITLKAAKDAVWHMATKGDLSEGPPLAAASVADAVQAAVNVMPRDEVMNSLLKTLRDLP